MRACAKLTTRFPGLGATLWRDTLIDAAIFREWMTGIGRRTAFGRIAHLFCELYLKLEAVGLEPIPVGAETGGLICLPGRSAVRWPSRQRSRTTAFVSQTSFGGRWSRCYRRGQRILWAAIDRARLTGQRWMRSSSCCALAVSG